MRRRWLAVAALALAGAGGWLAWTGREPAPVQGPAPVPDGATVLQTLPDAEGKAQVWRLERREIAREALPDLVLPAQDPDAGRRETFDDAARALDARALESWKHGDLEQALQLFEAAVAADPDDWLIHADYGRLLFLLTADTEAFPHMERAAQLRPDEPRVWLDLQSFYERNILLQAAGAARERAEKLAAGRAIVRDDETGLWRLEDDRIFP